MLTHIFINMIKKYWLLILIVAYYSCKNKTSGPITGLEVITMHSEFSNKPDFILDTTFIPLEFCEDCIIGDFTKVLKLEDGFVISDKQISGQVYKFSDKGIFQFRIGNKGDGLGNYVLPFDISLVPGTDRLAVLDQNQQKILFYALSDGSFIEEIPINFQAKSIHFISPNKLAIHFDGQFSGLEKDSLAGILDLKSNEYTYKGVFDFSKTDQNLTAGDFFETPIDLLFSKSLNDTVYRVTEKGFFPKYRLDFGTKTVSDDIKVLPVMDMRMKMMQEMPFYHNGNIIENEGYLFFLWWGDDEFEIMSVWEKEKKLLYNYNGRELIFKRPFYIDDEFMYCFLTNADYENLDAEQPFLGLSENHLIIKLTLKE